MLVIVLMLAGLFFVFGLIQWARSGAVLWDIRAMLKAEAGPAETAQENPVNVRKFIQSKEMVMDSFLRSSLRALGILAFFVWLFVFIVVLVDALNLDWFYRFRFSPNRILGNPLERASGNSPRSTGDRNEIFRGMGSGFK